MTESEVRKAILSAATFGGILLASMMTSQGAARDPGLPNGENRTLIYGRCRTCHDLQYLVESKGLTRKAWSDILDSMTQYGLRLPAAERLNILDYLATHLGPDQTQATNTAQLSTETNGAIVFKEQCERCHGKNGEGIAGRVPPLAGNRDLSLPEDYQARVALFGLEGKIEVNGQEFNAEMPSFSALSDQSIAAVVHYIREAWSNSTAESESQHSPENDLALIERLRQYKAITPERNHELREMLKGTEQR